MNDSWLTDVVAAQKRGKARGVVSICSANPHVLDASFRFALARDMPLLIESTCNQVNQDGGYTGMRPPGFVRWLQDMAHAHQFRRHRLILGGDHLGPSPWQDETAATAMAKARRLVTEYASAGYEKIHLDASMKCADDDIHQPLPKEVAASRSAELAEVAEAAYQQRGASRSAPLYVIGTEVPRPGGALELEEQLAVTLPEDVEETINITRHAFEQRGLASVWERVIAVVVQPGVEFGDDSLVAYDRARARQLVHFIEQHPRLVYEAHSTDYQTAAALRHLVEDHFAILKVGPALTFALREAIFALSQIEAELLAGQPGVALSRLPATLESAMQSDPVHWKRHYRGTIDEQRIARKYSYSDRIRYYWATPEVEAALRRLWSNLATTPIPMTLISQYLPVQYERIRQGRLVKEPRALAADKVGQVLADYAFACGSEAS